MDYLLYLLIAIVAVVIYAKIIKCFAKKEKIFQNDMLSKLSNEQVENLKENEVEIANDNEKSYSWRQKGFIGKVVDQGKSFQVAVLWYNTVIQNATLNDFQFSDIKISKEEFDKKGLKKGSIVKILIEPHKTKTTIV